ncbi:hypothetical protein FKM82_022557 [Ascaphus truei]
MFSQIIIYRKDVALILQFLIFIIKSRTGSDQAYGLTKQNCFRLCFSFKRRGMCLIKDNVVFLFQISVAMCSMNLIKYKRFKRGLQREVTDYHPWG